MATRTPNGWIGRVKPKSGNFPRVRLGIDERQDVVRLEPRDVKQRVSRRAG